MRYGSRPSEISPLLAPEPRGPQPAARAPRTQPRQHRQSRSQSRAFDPHDLAARLESVLAEREAAELREGKRRVQSVAEASRSEPQLPGESGRGVVPQGNAAPVEPAADLRVGAKEGFSSSRSRKAMSFHGPRDLEYSMWQRSHTRASIIDDDRDRMSPLLSEPLRPPPSTARGSVSNASGDASGPVSSAPPSSKRPSQAGIPDFAVSHFGPMTAEPCLIDSPVHPSIKALRESEPLSPRGHRRRSSLRASKGSWDGLHEPTIFEAVPSDAKPGNRRTMFETSMRNESPREAQDTRPRTMSTGDLLQARKQVTDDTAAYTDRPSSTGPDVAYYEIANERRVYWARPDEDPKMTRSKKLFRKADSILRLRRGSSAKANDSSEGSPVEERESSNAAHGGGATKSPKSPKQHKSFWPFKKQVTV
ncbi:uncharacterized protein DNG_01583 [Cephalotrichum gorgonifer]|uniref:Uncharacterized protein n=1 Tax=Cephalotrichum gorgonifer TaxID=2041049 RepID=A0AAE8SRY5_9PEZI|nr:uncharacterized protein DNG_01583 [Cephalotrichum gorgonifer]